MKTSFDKKSHKYLIDGKPATGVTTIIGVLAKPQLIQWSSNLAAAVGLVKQINDEEVELLKSALDSGISSDKAKALGIKIPAYEEARTYHTKKKEAAGEHGTDTHALVEVYINQCLQDWAGKPITVRPADSPIVQFIDWSCDNVDHFLFSERQMYNKELFIAGTADFAYIGKDGKKYMADFKTSSGIYGIDYWLQVAAYRMLAEGEGDEGYDGATIVRMGKDGSFEVNQLYEYETFKEAFLCCLTLYRAQAAVKDLVIK